MCFVYTVQNINPRLGARKGDRQAISVYDRNIGNRRDIITTPDAAEEFISDRNKALKSANNICNGLFASGIAIGAAIGAAIMAKKASKLGKLIEEKLNPRYAQKYEEALQEHIQKGFDKDSFSGYMAREDVLREDAFKNLSFKLRDLFSEDKNAFVKPNMTKESLEGAGVGALGGTLVGIMPSFVIPENADKKVTAEFIENNK